MSSIATEQYDFAGAFMDKSVPSTMVAKERFSHVAGTDGRFLGCHKKLWGMRLAVDLRSITGSHDTITAITAMDHTVVQKGDTQYLYRGFVVRYGTASDQTVVWFYYDTESSAWASRVIWASGNSIDSSSPMDVAADGKFLYVALEGKATQTIYYDGSSLVQSDSGPGQFHDNHSDGTSIPEPEYVDEYHDPDSDSSTAVTETGGYLTGGGVYQVAYRFYNSTRQIYSALSDRVTITLTSASTEEDVLVVMGFPTTGSPSWFLEENSGAGFAELFDKVQIFRTTNLGTSGLYGGALLFHESTVDRAGSAGSYTWGGAAWALTTFNVGSMRDEVLTTQDRYDPWMDIVVDNPTGGALGLYGGLLWQGDSLDSYGGKRALFSSMYHESKEYFTTLGHYNGHNEDGKPLAFVQAGESMYIMTANSLVFAKKIGASIRFNRLHVGRGLVNGRAAHTVGNEALLLTPMGFAMVDGQKGTMNILTPLNRVVADRWSSYLSGVQSGYDAKAMCSMFLEPTSKEILCIWHNTAAMSFIEGANYSAITYGVHPTSGGQTRAWLATPTGRILTLDLDRDGSGTLTDVASGKTINGTATSASSAGVLTDSSATFDDAANSSMDGAMVYFTDGALAGTFEEIGSVDSGTQITLSDTSVSIAVGQGYAIGPVVYKARLANLPLSERNWPNAHFSRRVMTGIMLDSKNLTTIPSTNGSWRVGAYRNGSSTLADTISIDFDSNENPADQAGRLNVSAINLEPYIEQGAAGFSFELTSAMVYATINESRNDND